RSCASSSPTTRRRRARGQPYGARQQPRAADAVLRRRCAAGDQGRRRALPRRDRYALPQGRMSATELRVFIADDEAPARARLKELLADIRGELPTVVAGEAANGLEVIERLPGC